MSDNEYTDIHCHILMGVDDGANDIEESIHMLHMAYQDGIHHIILTPHYKDERHSASKERILQKYELLLEKIQKEQLPIQIYLGNELYYSSNLVQYLEENRVFTLGNQSNYILVEFNPMEEYVYIRNGLNELLCNGYQPILAHAERYECLFEQKKTIERIKESSALIQINESSIMGKTGMQYKKRAKLLLKEELVDFIATDAHDSQKRVPAMAACGRYIRKKYGDSYYHRIFYENPDSLLHNREI